MTVKDWSLSRDQKMEKKGGGEGGLRSNVVGASILVYNLFGELVSRMSSGKMRRSRRLHFMNRKESGGDWRVKLDIVLVSKV
jgi:hypothetical protein